MRQVLGAVLVVAAFAAAAPAEDVATPPDLRVHMEAIRYDPVETDMHWDSWISGGVGVVSAGRATLYFDAGVETLIGNTLRAFDATQANYHLEPGVRWRFGDTHVGIMFHHVSRHYVDRTKKQAVDWNVLGVRATGPFGHASPLHGWYMLSAGHTTEAAHVGYGWEFVGDAETDLVSWGWGAAYARGALRGVTAEPTRTLPRGSFVDVNAEGGVRWDRGTRRLALFAAYERRNDVFLESPGVRERALFGFRIDYRTDASAGPSWR
jgi:hypothetical protein